MGTKLKWAILIIALIASTGLAVYVYLGSRKSNDFTPLIKTKLADLVSKASDGLYVLTMDDIEVDIVNSHVTATGIQLLPDTARMSLLLQNRQLPDDIYHVSLKALHIDGISPVDFINGKHISLAQILLDSPTITITHKKRNYNSKDTGNFYNRIAPEQQSYELKKLLLSNAMLTYKNLDKHNQASVFHNLTAYFNDIKIDAASVKDTSRFLFAKEAVISLIKYSSTTGNKLYNFSIDSIALKPQKGILLASNIRLKPVGTKDEFSDKLSYLQDRFDILIENAVVKDINWWSLIGGEGLFGSAVKIEGGYINVYDDKRLPFGKTKMGNYPHQLLMKAGIPIKLHQVDLKDIKLTYEEFNPKSDNPGKIEFHRVNGSISNITNVPGQVNTSPMMTAKATAKFMNEADLTAAFGFDLSNAAAGKFTADASLSAMDGIKLNPITEGLGLVKIETLTIDKLEAHLMGDNNSAKGTVQFAYHNLKISALKKDKAETGKLKKRAFLSFIANAFVVKNDSPSKGDTLKTYDASYQRDPNKSFFNLIWKTISDGILKTVKGKKA